MQEVYLLVDLLRREKICVRRCGHCQVQNDNAVQTNSDDTVRKLVAQQQGTTQMEYSTFIVFGHLCLLIAYHPSVEDRIRSRDSGHSSTNSVSLLAFFHLTPSVPQFQGFFLLLFF